MIPPDKLKLFEYPQYLDLLMDKLYTQVVCRMP